MSDNVRAVLRPYCKGRPADALVFEHEAKPGEPICASSLYRRFRNAARRAGLPVLRFHDLRHSFGTTPPNPEAAATLSGLWSGDEPAANVAELSSVA
jgi:integrase